MPQRHTTSPNPKPKPKPRPSLSSHLPVPHMCCLLGLSKKPTQFGFGLGFAFCFGPCEWAASGGASSSRLDPRCLASRGCERFVAEAQVQLCGRPQEISAGNQAVTAANFNYLECMRTSNLLTFESRSQNVRKFNQTQTTPWPPLTYVKANYIINK